MADGAGPVFTAQLQTRRVARAGKGRRGENPRNREDHPVRRFTDEGGPPRARAATHNPRTLTCWCVAEPVPQLDDYRLDDYRGKKARPEKIENGLV